LNEKLSVESVRVSYLTTEGQLEAVLLYCMVFL